MDFSSRLMLMKEERGNELRKCAVAGVSDCESDSSGDLGNSLTDIDQILNCSQLFKIN